MKFTKAANLNKRVLTIREERTHIGQAAFIKIALSLYRPTTYARLFEEEWCTYNLSLKWKTLSKWKDRCFKLENAAKTGNFNMETILERDLRKFYTVSRKPIHCKCKIQLLFNKIRFHFEHLLTRTWPLLFWVWKLPAGVAFENGASEVKELLFQVQEWITIVAKTNTIPIQENHSVIK